MKTYRKPLASQDVRSAIQECECVCSYETVPARPWRLNPHESVNTGIIVLCLEVAGLLSCTRIYQPHTFFKPVCLSDWYRTTISNEMLLTPTGGRARRWIQMCPPRGQRMLGGSQGPTPLSGHWERPPCMCVLLPSLHGYPPPSPSLSPAHTPCARLPLFVYM